MNALIWLIVGKEMKGNHVVRYCFLCSNGNRHWVRYDHAASFVRKNKVINVSTNGDSIIGNGIQLSALPKYVNQGGFGLTHIGGLSEAQIIQMCQPIINSYNQKELAKQQREQAKNNGNNDKLQYIVNKLQIINAILDYSLKMKDITNELASEGQFVRYLKQIDIDNSSYDPLTNLVKTKGVNGLANGLIDRLEALWHRAVKYELQKEVINNTTIKEIIKTLKQKCETLKNLHSETKEIIKDNKKQVENTEVDSNDNLMIVSDDTPDLVSIDDDIPVVLDEENSLVSIDETEDIPIIADNETDSLVPIDEEPENIPIIADNETDSLVPIDKEPSEHKNVAFDIIMSHLDNAGPDIVEFHNKMNCHTVYREEQTGITAKQARENQKQYKIEILDYLSSNFPDENKDKLDKFLDDCIKNLIMSTDLVYTYVLGKDGSGSYVIDLVGSKQKLVNVYKEVNDRKLCGIVHNKVYNLMKPLRDLKYTVRGFTYQYSIKKEAAKILDDFGYSPSDYELVIHYQPNYFGIESMIMNEIQHYQNQLMPDRFNRLMNETKSNINELKFEINGYIHKIVLAVEDEEKHRKNEMNKNNIRYERDYALKIIENRLKEIDDLDTDSLMHDYTRLQEENYCVGLYKYLVQALVKEVDRVKIENRNLKHYLEDLK